jgi:Fe-S-cluster-containing dehydrogenase component
MLVDQERCIGCWSCAVICKSENDVALGMWWNRILTAGESSTPRRWASTAGSRCSGCRSPASTATTRPARRCARPGATFTTRDGVVMVNADDCIGCRYCMAACPYGVRTFNWGEPAKAHGRRRGHGRRPARSAPSRSAPSASTGSPRTRCPRASGRARPGRASSATSPIPRAEAPRSCVTVGASSC